MPDQQQPGPYQQACEKYADAGWPGPIPVAGKFPPPRGWTGWQGGWPSAADRMAWCEDLPTHNIALRLPDGVLGIDVDAYGDKLGAQTLAACELVWGQLPATWITTSRDDGVSGIRLFRVPTGLDWPGQLPGGGVETVHIGHRYAMVWPSVHPNGRVYRWIDPLGITALVTVPAIVDLAALPQAWVDNLSRGPRVDEPKADITIRQASSWVSGQDWSRDKPCPLMKRTTDTVVRSLGVTGGRHDQLLTGLLTLVRFGEAGHPGLSDCLEAVYNEWGRQVIQGDKSRTADQAEAEFDRAQSGAVAKVMAAPTPGSYIGDPCRPPVPGIKSAMAAVASTPILELAGMSEQQRIDVVREFTQDEGPVAYVGEQGPELGVWPTAGGRVELTGQPPEQELPPSEPAPGPPRTSWWPVDLAGLLDGSSIAQPPTVLARADGQLLWYPGRVNGLIGPSESGKSWIALEACRQVMAAGGRVAYLDFEDTPAGIVGRLLALGCPKAQLLEQFAYLSPEESLNGQGALDLAETLAGVQPVLTVLDGVNAAMSLLGFDLMSNGEATMFYQQVLQPLTKDGAVVTYIDHTPKNDQEGLSRGALGAQAKRAMTTGAAIRCDIVAPFGRGQTGRLKLTVDKDRDGYVRGACEGGSVLGIATLTSDPEGGDVTVNIAAEVGTRTETGEFRPTVLMRSVSDFLVQMATPQSANQIEQAVRGQSTSAKRQALKVLISEGYVVTEPGPRNSTLHRVHHPYLGEEFTQSDDTPNDLARPRLTSPGEVGQRRSDFAQDRIGTPKEDRGRPPGEVSAAAGIELAELEGNPRYRNITGEWVDMTSGEIVEARP